MISLVTQRVFFLFPQVPFFAKLKILALVRGFWHWFGDGEVCGCVQIGPTTKIIGRVKPETGK